MNTQINKLTIALIAVIVFLIGYIVWIQRPLTSERTGPPIPIQSETVTTTNTAAPAAPTKSPGTSASKPTPKTTTSTAVKSQAPSMTKDGLYIISYTDRGFSPATLQLTKGKGVHFINNSNKAMRIFSDLPNDRIYGAITQSKTVGKGGTYDFVFNDAGNWGYYNANNSSDRGTVVVTEQ